MKKGKGLSRLLGFFVAKAWKKIKNFKFFYSVSVLQNIRCFKCIQFLLFNFFKVGHVHVIFPLTRVHVQIHELYTALIVYKQRATNWPKSKVWNIHIDFIESLYCLTDMIRRRVGRSCQNDVTVFEVLAHVIGQVPGVRSTSVVCVEAEEVTATTSDPATSNMNHTDATKQAHTTNWIQVKCDVIGDVTKESLPSGRVRPPMIRNLSISILF